MKKLAYALATSMFVGLGAQAHAEDETWTCAMSGSAEGGTPSLIKYTSDGKTLKGHSQDSIENAFLENMNWQVIKNTPEGLIAVDARAEKNATNKKQNGEPVNSLWIGAILIDKASGQMLNMSGSAEDAKDQIASRWACIKG